MCSSDLGAGIHSIKAQEKFNLSAGIGLPELIHAGVRYQTGQAEISASIGAVPAGRGEQVISLSGDFYYYLSGHSKFSERKPTYLKVGLNFLHDETETIIDKYLSLNSRIGRDFNITDRFGVWAELGVMWIIQNKEIEKKTPGSFNLQLFSDLLVLPGFGDRKSTRLNSSHT